MSGSPFAVRGVVEGFYGRPWSHQQRLDLIPFLADRGMNTFVYAAKDDPLVRRDWRTPYDGTALERLAELHGQCREHGLDLVWCISPGLSIRYSDDRDVSDLRSKLDSVAALGIDRFGLLLDDIPMELQHARDRAAFGSLAEAHAALVGRAYTGLRPGSRLVVCPTVYRGTGSEPYLVALAARIDPSIDLFWTGRQICSPTLDLADATAFQDSTNRAVNWWDNYPVNDVAMGYELHIGPYRGRDPRLWRASRGIVANGMELYESSKIAFATIADYLRSPATYDPETSWRAALRDVVGEADLDAFTLFADNVRSSCLSDEDAPILGQALESFRFELEHGDGIAAARDLCTFADRMLGAADRLLRGPVTNAALIEEVRPWLAGFELGGRAIRRIAELAAEGRLEAEGAVELLPYQVKLRRARVRVFGDVLEMTLSDLTGRMFRPGEVPELEGGGT
jgi:hyaluronoglucosaminidase